MAGCTSASGAIVTRSALVRVYKFDTKYFRPAFSRDPNSTGFSVLSYTVENIGIGLSLFWGQQPLGGDFAGDSPGFRIDNHDSVSQPDVGPNFAVDPLEFVEFSQRFALQGDV